MATHSSILASKFHGQRSLVGCSPWGHKKSQTRLGMHPLIIAIIHNKGNDKFLDLLFLTV